MLVASVPSEVALGRAAAERLATDWPDVSWVPTAPSTQWAGAAIRRFAKMIGEQLPIFRASQQGAGRGARSLSPRTFQGVLEALQNADDLGATELRLAVRQGTRGRELLIVHNGNRVQLHHVGAMVLPWLSTKDGDPDTSGRFGIGQQTLKALGGPLQVHCAPFAFSLEEGGPEERPAASAVPGLYDPARHETLFVLPLRKEGVERDLEEFVSSLGTKSLLFLRSVRRICLLDLATGVAVADLRLDLLSRAPVALTFPTGEPVTALKARLASADGTQYTRYSVDRVVAQDGPVRLNKATGSTTPLGVALSLAPHARGGVYDRLPLPLQTGLAASLDAQFNPDAARTTVLEDEWNESRFEELGQLLAVTAVDLFASDPALAWWAVPLRSEVTLPTGTWLYDQFLDKVVGAAQRLILERVRLRMGGTEVPFDSLVYEEASLDGLLQREDLEGLRPGLVTIGPDFRDALGRWRTVLEELGAGSRVETEEALQLFEADDVALGEREPRWFVGMARTAVEADLLEPLLRRRSVLLDDGSRIEPPGHNDPLSLVCRVDEDSLGSVLGLALPIHAAYLSGEPDAARVEAEFREQGVLLDDVAADKALDLLARDFDGNTLGRVRLDDRRLLALRDALSRRSVEEQRSLGARIGRNLELRGFRYSASGTQVEEWLCPAEAYLPSAVDREKDSFAAAAAKTPGLAWLHPDYARVLKHAGGRQELGAQRFLRRLGAATAPRLQRPPDESQVLKRDARLASRALRAGWPAVQAAEIGRLSYVWDRYLLHDHHSPDLLAVAAHIATDRSSKRRRRRGLTLLGLLVRTWDRTYSEFEHADAVYKYYGSFWDPQPVVATWLAELMSTAWLPSASGRSRAPKDLALPTELSRIGYGSDKSLFLAKVDERLLRSPALKALRLKRGPTASELVERLRVLKKKGEPTPEIEREAETVYHLLALHCTGDTRRVDDMGLREFRDIFLGNGRDGGLLLVGRQWRLSSEVFGGEHLFPRHRPFAPRGPHLQPLWSTLQLKGPEVQDCAAVLRELASSPLPPQERGTVVQTLRYMGGRLDSASPQFRATLKKLPLWTGAAWTTRRPVYAIDDPELARQAADQVPVWASGFSSYSGLEKLCDALDVVRIGAEDFRLDEILPSGVTAEPELRRQYSAAVQHLQDALAGSDQKLHDSLVLRTTWDALAAAPVVIDDGLRLRAALPGGGSLSVAASAAMHDRPLAIVVRDAAELGSAEGAGRAVASLFQGDRQKVAWAWGAMWAKAGSGLIPEKIVLSTAARPEPPTSASRRLLELQKQAADRTTRKQKNGEAAPPQRPTSAVTVKPLKDLAAYSPDRGAVVNPGAAHTGVILGRRGAEDGRAQRERAKDGTLPTRNTGPARRTVLPPADEREELALSAIRDALRLDAQEIVDLRKRHGLGADAVDELRQFYEIKMQTSGGIPNEVTLQPSQLEAAEDEDFFLAVVSGLAEDESELRVRFIFEPLKKLRTRIKGEATLVGVSDVEALEYRFHKRSIAE